MLRHKRNANAIQTPSDAEHVKLKERPLFHPPQQRLTLPHPPLLQRLLANQRLNARLTFSLELYHKNVIKKDPHHAPRGQASVFRLTKNVCQT
ncbi:hypothetical protein KR009_003937 [Drosophila setifemur]|nr:hypothetical protein KR009_003937 [Drosophila setifemur]